jgi:hypothetical protein
MMCVPIGTWLSHSSWYLGAPLGKWKYQPVLPAGKRGEGERCVRRGGCQPIVLPEGLPMAGCTVAECAPRRPPALYSAQPTSDPGDALVARDVHAPCLLASVAEQCDVAHDVGGGGWHSLACRAREWGKQCGQM